MTTQPVTSGRARLAVESDGTGTPVVLLHSGVTDRGAWDDVAAALRDRAQVVRYDRRGFGGTTADPEDHDDVTDLLAVLDAHGVDRAVLVGNSLGGRIALEAALDERSRVSGLVLIAPAISGATYPVDVEQPEQVDELERAVQAAEERGDLDEVNRLEAWFWLDGPVASEGRVGGRARERFLAMNGRALRAPSVGGARQREPVFQRLAELRIPVTVAYGDLDEPVMVPLWSQVAERIQGADLVRWEGVAHTPQLERPDLVVAAIDDLLARV